MRGSDSDSDSGRWWVVGGGDVLALLLASYFPTTNYLRPLKFLQIIPISPV